MDNFSMGINIPVYGVGERMKIKLIAPSIWNTDGYGFHSRNLALALSKICDLQIDAPPCPITDYPELVECQKKDYGNKTPTILISFPSDVPLYKPMRADKIITYCVWEGDKIPYGWMKGIEQADYVLCPSFHSREAIINRFKEQKRLIDLTKLIICPHGVDYNVFKPITERKDEFKKDTFHFITCGGWRLKDGDRKGIDKVLKAFQLAFKKEDNVSLFLKINKSYGGNVEEFIRSSGIHADMLHKIMIHTEIVKESLLNEIYNNMNCGVTMSANEAFNIPVLELMACGKPSIYSNVGGHNEYAVGLPVKSNGLKPATDDNPLYSDTNWEDPDIEDCARQMRYAYEHQDEIKKLGEQALEKSKAFSWDNTAKIILSLVQ